MSLLMPDSEACMWVGFQIIYGIGRGISLSTVSPFFCSALRGFVFLAREDRRLVIHLVDKVLYY